MRPSSEVPFFDTEDTGKFVGAIFNVSEKSERKVLNGVNGLYLFGTIVNIINKVTGKNVNYKQIPEGLKNKCQNQLQKS